MGEHRKADRLRLQFALLARRLLAVFFVKEFVGQLVDDDSATRGGGKRLLDLDQTALAQSLGRAGDGLVDKLDAQQQRSPLRFSAEAPRRPSVAFESISGNGSPSVCSRAKTAIDRNPTGRDTCSIAPFFFSSTLRMNGSKDANAMLTLFDEAA